MAKPPPVAKPVMATPTAQEVKRLVEFIGAPSGLALQVDGRCHSHEWERNELGGAAGALLHLTVAHHVPFPGPRPLDGPVHDLPDGRNRTRADGLWIPVDHLFVGPLRPRAVALPAAFRCLRIRSVCWKMRA